MPGWFDWWQAIELYQDLMNNVPIWLECFWKLKCDNKIKRLHKATTLWQFRKWNWKLTPTVHWYRALIKFLNLSDREGGLNTKALNIHISMERFLCSHKLVTVEEILNHSLFFPLCINHFACLQSTAVDKHFILSKFCPGIFLMITL